MTKGVKVKIHPRSFRIEEGDFESIAQFWGIEPNTIGEVTGIAAHPFQPHPIIHWEKCDKPCFQDVSWDESNLVPVEKEDLK